MAAPAHPAGDQKPTEISTTQTSPVSWADDDKSAGFVKQDERQDDLADPEDSQASSSIWPWARKARKPVDLDAIATVRSVFDDPELGPHYVPRPDYENIHRFDINERWTHREERAVRRKIDWKIFLWTLIMFFGLNIDRGNLGNAVAGGLLEDIHVTTNDYNNASNMYRIGFLIAEIPSQMIGKKLGPDRWIPIQIMCWSIVAGAQFFMTNRAGFWALRFLIGLFMGGFIPDSILYLSYFYKSDEMPVRLAFFWFTDSISGVIASFIAYGVFHMHHLDGREVWRWLFLIEAIISFVIGFCSILFLVPGPCQTKSWWHPKGYFTEREEKIIVNRVLRDDPSKGDMHNRQAITIPMLWRSLKDYDLWPVYLIGIMFEIPQSPPKGYLQISLKALNFNKFQITLLGIPPTIFGAINMLWIAWIAEYWHQLTFLGIFTQLWMLPLLIVEYTSAGTISNWGQYVVMMFLIGQPSMQAPLVSWCSELSNTVRTRAVSASAFNIMIQLSGIASSNIYRKDDSPLYHRGNKQLIAINVAVIVVYALAKVYYMFRNKQKLAKWNSMTKDEQSDYLDNTKDQGNKRLDFLFRS